MGKGRILLLVICSIIVSSTGTYFGVKWYSQTDGNGRNDGAYFDSDGEMDLTKVERAYRIILNEYVEEVDAEALVEGAVEGMLNKLNDPYSVYMDEKQSEEFDQSLNSSFQGIGAEISEMDGKIIIVAPFKNSPAERAGLKPMDQIIHVDGEDITDLDLYDVTLKIRGEKGTTVSLGIMREGLREPISVEVVRDQIPIETVFSKVMEDGNRKIGYMEITSFSRDTGKDFAHQLKVMEKEGIAGLIIDVRGNPGGLLSSVEEIVHHFVTDKKPFIQIEEKNGDREQLFTNRTERKPYPIAVLTDQGSASASEILAAALKEGEGYPTIGEKTFGKGTVQQQIDLGDRSHIKLTMYKWLSPDGRWIHGEGIEPDIEVAQPELYRLHPIQVKRPLKRDMNNEQIKNAQKLLRSIGFEPGRTDGYFNETTEIAVKNFQRAHGLPATGFIDEETVKEMERVVLQEMEKMENDRQLQMALKYFEYAPGE